MAALNKVASYFADEIRNGIAWVIIWKNRPQLARVRCMAGSGHGNLRA